MDSPDGFRRKDPKGYARGRELSRQINQKRSSSYRVTNIKKAKDNRSAPGCAVIALCVGVGLPGAIIGTVLVARGLA